MKVETNEEGKKRGDNMKIETNERGEERGIIGK